MRRIAALTAQIVQTALDVIAAISGAYYSKKYSTIARRLGLPRMTASNERGFVVIQIDGLAHSHLMSAIDSGYVPHLERTLRRGEFLLRRWHVGLPCTTPAAQAGIMYGNNEDIPAYRWYDKDADQAVLCRLPGTIKAIQDRISKGSPGILKGGSSFMNMFDGDASLSMFTLGAMNRKQFFASVKGLGFFLLFILNPFRTVKVLGLAIWEYFTDLFQRTSAMIKKENPRPLEPGFPFFRIISNVVLREIQTFAVMVDIYRGVPSIYTTYYGYDELAHNYGPYSRIAFRALHAIDHRVHQIDTLRRMALTREYDLYILSDHGMTSAIPFEREHEQTLGEFIRDRMGGGLELSEAVGSDEQNNLQTIYLMDELAAIESNVTPSLAHIPRKIRQLVSKRAMLNLEDEDSWDLQRYTDLVVRNSGSMSHVYLRISAKQMDISEIAAFQPNLMSDLAAHPGIWLVIGREGEQVVVMSKEGVLSLEQGYSVEGQDPLALLPNPRMAAEQLRRLARFPHSGDLILMGSYDPEKEVVVCFEQQWACHGGLGGAQESAFMVRQSSIDWDLENVTQATQLYPFFMRRYGTRHSPDASPSL